MAIIIHFLWQTIWFTLSHTLNTFSMADNPNPIQSKGFLSSSKVLDGGRGAAISPLRTFPLDIHSKKKSCLSNTHTEWVHQLQGTFSNRKKKNG